MRKLILFCKLTSRGGHDKINVLRLMYGYVLTVYLDKPHHPCNYIDCVLQLPGATLPSMLCPRSPLLTNTKLTHFDPVWQFIL